MFFDQRSVHWIESFNSQSGMIHYETIHRDKIDLPAFYCVIPIDPQTDIQIPIPNSDRCQDNVPWRALWTEIEFLGGGRLHGS